MTPRSILFTAACLLFLAVAAGAFGAHALRTRLSPDLLGVFQTAAQYHFLHALGLLAIGILWLQWPEAGRGLAWSALLLLAGATGEDLERALEGVREREEISTEAEHAAEAARERGHSRLDQASNLRCGVPRP